MREIIGYVVSRDGGCECELCLPNEKGMNEYHPKVPKGGVLLWGDGFSIFANRRRANRAIKRTKEWKKKPVSFDYRIIPIFKEAPDAYNH